MSFDSLLRRSGVPTSHARFESYYEGTARLDALGVNLPPQVRVLEQIAPFPKLSIDVLSEVLVPEGFILGDDEKAPRLLGRFWQANDMDTQVRLAIVEALVQGVAYWIVGPGDKQSPRITAENGVGVAVERDHFGNVAEGIKRYKVGDRVLAAHYLPGVNHYYEHTPNGWARIDELRTGASRPAIVPMLNRARLRDITGRSELLEILTPTDAASRTLTGLQISQELLAMPVRYVFGKGLETMRDPSGNPVDKIQAYMNRFITGPEGASAGQIPGADLRSIIEAYTLYAKSVSSITGIPPAMLGITSDNPSSAEAMRVAKDRLITRAEAKASMFGDALEDVARLALEVQGALPEDHALLELRWRDPATPSESAMRASLLQAHAQGVISATTAREGLRLTPQQMAREAARERMFSTATDQLGG